MNACFIVSAQKKYCIDKHLKVEIAVQMLYQTFIKKLSCAPHALEYASVIPLCPLFVPHPK